MSRRPLTKFNGADNLYRRDSRTPAKYELGLLVLVLLATGLDGCNVSSPSVREKSKEEIQKHEEERAKNLEEWFEATNEQVKKLEENGQQQLRDFRECKTCGNVVSDFKSYSDQITKCYDLISQIDSAGHEKRYRDIPSIAVKGLVMGQALSDTALHRSQEVMNKIESLLKSEQISAIKKATAEGNSHVGFAQIGGASAKVFLDYLNALMLNGPPDVRLQTFETVAREYPSAKSTQGLRLPIENLMQQGYAAEDRSENRTRMAELFGSLNIPSTPEKEATKTEGRKS